MNPDLPIRQLFEDRAQLNRLVRSVQLDRGEDFVIALERAHTACDPAIERGDATLRGALKWLGDADYLTETLRVLERRDAVVERAFQEATGATVRTNERGVVLLLRPVEINDNRP